MAGKKLEPGRVRTHWFTAAVTLNEMCRAGLWEQQPAGRVTVSHQTPAPTQSLRLAEESCSEHWWKGRSRRYRWAVSRAPPSSTTPLIAADTQQDVSLLTCIENRREVTSKVMSPNDRCCGGICVASSKAQDFWRWRPHSDKWRITTSRDPWSSASLHQRGEKSPWQY